MTTMSTRLQLMITALSLLTFAATSTFALGSGEKSPEEKAADDQKKATRLYNDGVKAMESARTIGQKGDSIFAYNYRATSDAKARKEFEKAVGKFNQAVELNPKLAEAHNNLGYCYRKLGKLDESLKAYEKAIGLKPDFAKAREYRGETYLAMDQPDKATTELDFLKQMRSPLADTLAKAIEVYQLEAISAKAHSGK
ncbi:MAG: tetratricopeptide repeat protein [Candidatus Zixiibacteriota bacterium]